jgi:tripartite-type tricarboxylate transporter receptor subunit TctC
MRNFKTMLGAVATAAVAAFGATPAQADDVADFYKGKKITVVIGYGAGGGYDTYTRVLARHMAKYIPGNPAIVPQNMPGAGSLKAANYLYNAAPKDGTYLGVFSAPTALEPLFGNKNAKFETVKFAWLGNMFRDTHGCATWNNSGIGSLQQIIDSKTPVVFGATAAGSYGNQHALVLKNMVGANLKVITGYKGIKAVGLALQRGEIQAACAMAVSTVKSTFASYIKSGEMKMLVQFGKKSIPFMGGATNFYSMLRTDEQRTVADLFFGQSAIARPIAGPPGLKPAMVAALRKAMADSLKDPGLLADAARIGIDIEPESGEAVTRAFADFYKTPAKVVQQAKVIMGRK